MRTSFRQCGATLMVVLVMLVMITLFVVSMVRLSNTNLKIISNMQTQRALESSAQQALEDKLSQKSYFDDAIANAGVWPAGTNSIDTSVNGYTVTLGRPVCIASEIAPGYSLTETALEDTFWELPATATDPLTGAKVQIVQGIRMRLTAGSCT